PEARDRPGPDRHRAVSSPGDGAVSSPADGAVSSPPDGAVSSPPDGAAGPAAEPSVLVERHDLGAGLSAALLQLNRPDQLNPIDIDMLRDLDAAIDHVAADTSIQTLLVTGAGRAFSAGGDLKKYVALQRDPVEFPRFVSELHRIFGRLRSLAIPAVSLVNGVAAAGGLE